MDAPIWNDYYYSIRGPVPGLAVVAGDVIMIKFGGI
jgi:hypothetical protein